MPVQIAMRQAQGLFGETGLINQQTGACPLMREDDEDLCFLIILILMLVFIRTGIDVMILMETEFKNL